MSPLFEFSDVSGGYGGAVIVREVSATLQAGQVLAVLGRNGVGKTTLVQMLTGHLPLKAGSVRFKGQSVNRLAPHQHQRLGISYSPQERSVFDQLSVRENLSLVHPSPDLSRYRPYFDVFPKLSERLDQKAGTLSGGEKKLLSFVRVMAEGNPLVILDEPSEGVQPENIELMTRFIKERRQQEVGFLIVEQNLSFATEIATDFLVMDQGQVVFQDKASNTSKTALLEMLQV